MITDDFAVCPKCGYDRALSHYSSDYTVNWIACPKCRTYFDHDVEVPPAEGDEEAENKFWKNVEKGTGFKKEEAN